MKRDKSVLRLLLAMVLVAGAIACGSSSSGTSGSSHPAVDDDDNDNDDASPTADDDNDTTDDDDNDDASPAPDDDDNDDNDTTDDDDDDDDDNDDNDNDDNDNDDNDDNDDDTTCDAANCADGCCDASGLCQTSYDMACGLNGAACQVCANGTPACVDGVCVAYGACCASSTHECLDDTQADCLGHLGSWHGGMFCSQQPCGSGWGRCCMAVVGQCHDEDSQADCTNIWDGAWTAGGVCEDLSPCGGAVGACCTGAECVNYSQSACSTAGGTWSSESCESLIQAGGCLSSTTDDDDDNDDNDDDTTCGANTCANGCCDNSGVCQTSGNATCGRGGASCANCSANGQECIAGACVCDAASCPGGCCDASGLCQTSHDMACGLNGAACQVCANGTPACVDGVCVAYGACCNPYSHDCLDDTQADCLGHSGSWQGGAFCSQQPCGSGWGACCSISGGQCYDMNNEADCTSEYSGSWTAGSVCDDRSACGATVLGACCTGSECIVFSQSYCSEQGGTWSSESCETLIQAGGCLSSTAPAKAVASDEETLVRQCLAK
jgi:hypothetical protein